MAGRENHDMGLVGGPTGKKYILRVLRIMYSVVMDEKCRRIEPVPCPEDLSKINEDVVWCRITSKPKEVCVCYELEVGKTYYFISTNEKKKKSVTYKVLVTDKKTDIVEFSLAPPPCIGGE
jgi:NDP-sugar pyrophosphorylase family protein